VTGNMEDTEVAAAERAASRNKLTVKAHQPTFSAASQPISSSQNQSGPEDEPPYARTPPRHGRADSECSSPCSSTSGSLCSIAESVSSSRSRLTATSSRSGLSSTSAALATRKFPEGSQLKPQPGIGTPTRRATLHTKSSTSYSTSSASRTPEASPLRARIASDSSLGAAYGKGGAPGMTSRQTQSSDSGKQRIAALVNLWERKQQTTPDKRVPNGGPSPLHMASPLRQVSSRHAAVEPVNESDNFALASPQTLSRKNGPDSSPKAESTKAWAMHGSSQSSRTLDVWCRFANL
jgi:hypothetical protein